VVGAFKAKFGVFMLTPYDEFPIHQASRPFSHIPVSDFSWDDGYYFGVYSAEHKVFLFVGMRVNPNTNMVGGYAGINVDGIQHTFRFSRIWRPDFSTKVGPFSIEFEKPMEIIRLTLEENQSDLEFDYRWIAIAPPHEEAHHSASNHERVTTDQTRYTQGGTGDGWIKFKGKTYKVEPMKWFATRDHSWGIYKDRDPIKPAEKWLPPAEENKDKRSMRFWLPFQTPDYSGFYQFHEDEFGQQRKLNDTFGTPFEGVINYGFSGKKIHLVSAKHELVLNQGARSVSHGSVELVDENGDTWRHELKVACPPWSPSTIGYNVDGGSWKDGGNISSYHGSPLYFEHDEFDLRIQPYNILNYVGKPWRPHGREHLTVVKSTDPKGNVSVGLGQLEFLCEGRYLPYGFEK
jgi:hypothetical protein